MSSTEIRTKPVVWYYVETVADFEDEPGTIFRAHLVRATRPKDAEAEAIAEAREHFRHAHREPTEVRHFMTRRLKDEKATKIRAQFEAGTWEGWRF